MDSQYVPVQPLEHAPGCTFRRPVGQGDNDARGLDTEHCARCRALWLRLADAAARLDQDAGQPDPGTLPPSLAEMESGK